MRHDKKLVSSGNHYKIKYDESKQAWTITDVCMKFITILVEKYDSVEYFFADCFKVSINDKAYIIDVLGNQVARLTNEDLESKSLFSILSQLEANNKINFSSSAKRSQNITVCVADFKIPLRIMAIEEKSYRDSARFVNELYNQHIALKSDKYSAILSVIDTITTEYTLFDGDQSKVLDILSGIKKYIYDIVIVNKNYSREHQQALIAYNYAFSLLTLKSNTNKYANQ
ncbi:MAG: hypothetical protein ACRCZY_08280 [Phocaeicola sp.]